MSDHQIIMALVGFVVGYVLMDVYQAWRGYYDVKRD